MAPRKRFPTSLGDLVADWIERNCVHGPGDVYGERVRLTPEEHEHLEAVYAIDPVTGRRLIDEAVYSRRKGTRKSELGGWLVAAEARGPVRAWLEDGEPVAGPPHDPWILCAATTENQADLVYGSFRKMAQASDELRQLFDLGKEDTTLVDRPGLIQLVQTRNADALDGARPTFQVADEVHRWRTLLHESYDTLRSNLRKRRAAQPWLWTPTTAYQPGEQSIAEQLHGAVEHDPAASERPRALVVVGRFLHDHRQARDDFDLDDPEQLRAAIVEAGGDAHWSDVEAIAAEWNAPRTKAKPARYRRYWLNQPVSSDAQWVSKDRYRQLAVSKSVDQLRPSDEITLGFDGARFVDATALVATRVSDGLAQLIACWQRPEGVAGVGWEVPERAVDLVVSRTFDRYDVLRFNCDPWRWREVIGRWWSRYGDVVRELDTRKPSLIGPAIELAETQMQAGSTRFVDDEVLALHLINARRRTSHGYPRLEKERPGSPNKMDAAMAYVLANWGRHQVLTSTREADEGEREYAQLFY